MTDQITDQDRRLALRWCDMLGDSTLHKEAAATRRVILATVEAPTPTLAEELRSWAEDASYDEDRDNLLHAAARAEQMEHGIAEARAEVERLTAVQKGAESNAESIDPSDVKPGEPWLIRVRGRDAVAIRDGHEEWPWSVAFIHGESDEAKDDVVTLVSRLVPAPRVITNPDELERMAATSIIRDGRGWPGGITDQRVTMFNGFCASYEEVLSHRPVTVLW